MDEVKLLPCPFCGSERAKIESCYVRCMSCCADGPVMDAMPEGCEEDETGAIWNGEIVKLWNTRPTLVTGQLEGEGELIRKIACGLRQITDTVERSTLSARREVQEWQDRINGFAAELEAGPRAHPQPGPSQ